MRTALAVFVIFAAMVTAHGANVDTEWENFKTKYNRNFLSQPEHDLRKAIFADNLKIIDEHNAEHALGLHTYTLGINKFADMTNDEFVKLYNRRSAPTNQSYGLDEENIADVDISSLPASVDWRSKGYVTPIKDQGQCGSCWAFSAVVTMEGAHFKKTGNLVSLSEQQLMDCSNGGKGCNGGWEEDGITYVIKHGGIDTEKSYPYRARNGHHCNVKNAQIGATFRKMTRLHKGSEEALTKAVATIGPISIGIYAARNSFQLYESGVYYDKHCKSSFNELDHGVAVVGYGSENGKDY